MRAIGVDPVKAASASVLANDFARQWDSVREDALAALDRVGRSGWLVLGDEVRAFEEELARWWGVAHAVGVASGLDALEIALRCAALQPRARVLTTPFTAFATTLAIVRAGFEPVWCDVDETGGLDLAQAEAAICSDKRIRAVVPVHLYGHPMDLEALDSLAAEYGLSIVEDCAQSAGAQRQHRATGSSSVAAATSLYPTKNLGAMGDGGVVLTQSAGVADRARQLRDYGQRLRYEHVELGLNSRLDEVHAAILRSAFLPRLDGWLARRAEVAKRYVEALEPARGLRPIRPNGGESAWHLFPIEVVSGDPDSAARAIRKRGVVVGRHYPFVCPDQPAAHGLGRAVGRLSVARRLATREISLPIHPFMTDADVELVIEAVLEACA